MPLTQQSESIISELESLQRADDKVEEARPHIEHLPECVQERFDNLPHEAKLIACLWAIREEELHQWSMDFS